MKQNCTAEVHESEFWRLVLSQIPFLDISQYESFSTASVIQRIKEGTLFETPCDVGLGKQGGRLMRVEEEKRILLFLDGCDSLLQPQVRD